MPVISFKAVDGTAFKFTDAPQLVAFIASERASWAWLEKYANTQPGQQLVQIIIQPLSQAQAYLAPQELASIPTEVLDPVKSFVQTYLNVQPPVHPKTTLRQYLQKRVEVDEFEALYFLGAIFQKHSSLPRFSDNHGGGSSYVSGVALGMAWMDGLKENERAASAADSATESLKEAAQSLASTRALQADAAQVAQSLHELDLEQRQNLAELLVTLREENDGLKKELRDAVDAAKDGLNKEWKALTGTYDALLALKAPGTYWSAKKRSHGQWVGGLSVATAVAALGGGWFLYHLASVIFGTLPTTSLPTWLQAISFALGGVIYLWTVRSLLRFLLSHAHLALDAAERQTMIVSYLALTRKGGVKDEAMQQLFTSIFRPSGDGIVKDEGIPLPLVELLRGK